MKLTSNSETLAENKVLILYILNKIKKPISNNSLLSLVLSITDMNYFYFQQFLLDLLEKDYIITYNKGNHPYYELTDLGKRTLKLTENLIPGIIKLKIDNNFKDEVENIENKESIVAEYIPNGSNNFNVNCKIVENGETIFEVKVFAGSQKQAEKIVDNWKNNATILYPDIIKILIKGRN